MWFWGGTSSTSLQKEITDVSPQEFYSADHLLRLLDSLPPYDAIDERNGDFTIETLRQVAEVLVWGEQNNRGYFDIFCEQNVLSYFVQLAEQSTVPNAVKVQLLQTLSIIVQSINKETAVYYMFSNNYINSLLSTKFDFEDEEVASWYVSFIKSLSLLVNPDTIKLFLNERAKHFPIYSESVKFFRAKDSMVRTHSRNVTLSLFRVQDPSLRAFLIERPIFFSHVACYLRELVDGQLIRLTASRGASPENGIQDGVLEVEEMLFYVQDIFSLGVEEFSDLLAARLMVHCYLPIIGILGMERDRSNSVKREASTHETPDACPQLPVSGEEHCRIGSPKKIPEGDSFANAEKRVEQGWMWGWSTPEDLQEPKHSSGISDQLSSTAKGSSTWPVQTVDLSKSWRARAAEAISKRVGDQPPEKGAGNPCMVPDSTISAPCLDTPLQEAQVQNQWQSATNCDIALRLILFFLTQTFNCIQSEKLLHPLVAALLLQRIPKPLYDLIVAKAPATPEAYKNLRNPSKCAGHIELFLPIQEVSSSQETCKVTTDGGNTQTEPSQTTKGTSEGSSPSTGDHEEVPSTLSLEDRIRLLKVALSTLHKLGFWGELDGIERYSSLGKVRQLTDSRPSSSRGAEWDGKSCRGHREGNHIKWCHNPVQQHLLTLLDGCELAHRQCDVCFLLMTTLLQSIFRHASITTSILMRACILPSEAPITANTDINTSNIRRPSSLRKLKSEPSTPGRITLPRRSSYHHQTRSLARSTSLTRCSHFAIDRGYWVPSSTPATPSFRPHGLTKMQGRGTVYDCTYFEKMSWCFTAQMLDAIHAHLPNPSLRPITLRMAISVLSTLITEHILKVESFEYRAKSLEVLVNKMLRIRRAAAVATKLCLSALSDGHTIDVFWDEWEVHRMGAITDASFARDFRVLLSPESSQTESKSSAFPPYLLVATTDQEIERRSIQVFLLLRRLHRDLSAILKSIRVTPNDPSAVAQKAFSLLNGISVEPNPLESEDNAGHCFDVNESETLGTDTTPKLSLEGRNIIRCTVETSSGPATRYCVQDDKRFLLVTPSCIFPGVGDIRTSHPLRNVEFRLKTNSSRCMHLLVLDVVPPADGPPQAPPGDSPEEPPTMRVSLTAPPVKEGLRMDRPALWEIHLHFADALRCSTVFHSLQQARGMVRRNLASRIDNLLEEV
ncbi:hypothetical protein, conserved [Eimeria brunetti]|uniref:FPL domain-containing protein n=1 Tax=Eimeria brunetti TaxID=51314 RepID=U6LKD8_9EIME|nr:hypothetical protein, conserved [Eimeria brunetti]